jgi:amino acid transporter
VKRFTEELFSPAVKRCRFRYREASVPPPAKHRAASRRNFWASIARIFVVEILVLLGLSAAAVTYVNWSSRLAWAEFLAADKLAVPAPNSPIQEVSVKIHCEWRA